MAYDIGLTLKKCRNLAKMSVKEISDLLTAKGFKASESTIYSWENGNSQPTPGALLTMCIAYGIEDVLKTFGYDGYNDDGSIQLNLDEIELIEKYRDLDDHGKEIVDIVLDKEHARVTAKVIPLSRPSTIAAHFEGDEFTEDELDEIREFTDSVKNKEQ